MEKYKEPRLHFNLRQVKDVNKSTIIYAVFVEDGKQYKISTKAKIKPRLWHKETETPIISNLNNVKENQNSKKVFNIISHFRFCFSKSFLYTCNEPNEKLVMRFLVMINHNIKIKKKENMEKQTIIKWFYKSIETTDQKAKSKGTQKRYTERVRWLERFLDVTEDNISDLADIAKLKFFKNFRTWLLMNMKGRDGKSANLDSIQKVVNTIHTLLKQAIVEDIITNSVWIDCKLPNLVDNSAKDNQPFLTNDEVIKIYNYTPTNKTEEKVKDLFLLECTCGQRFGDIQNLGKCVTVIHDDMVINCITQKENRRVHCSIIFDIAKQILLKYNFILPTISNEKYNVTIKEIARKCGLNRPWKKSLMKGNEAKATVIEGELWQFIHSHTARHTFDSLLLMRGMSYTEIAEYSGHTEEMVKSYTRACNDVFRTQFRKQQEETPHLIVKTIKEVNEEKGQIKADTFRSIKPFIEEYKRVLAFLNVDASLWFESDDVDHLHRLIVTEEHRLLEKYHIHFGTVKEIYNSNTDIREKRKALNDLKAKLYSVSGHPY